MWPQFLQDIWPSTIEVCSSSVCRSLSTATWSASNSPSLFTWNSGFSIGSASLPRSCATRTTAGQSTRSRMLIRNSGLNSMLSSCTSWHSPYASGKLSLLVSQPFTEHFRKLVVKNFIVQLSNCFALCINSPNQYFLLIFSSSQNFSKIFFFSLAVRVLNFKRINSI